MKTREKFKREIIKAIHGKPYEEAVKKEEKIDGCLFWAGCDKPLKETTRSFIMPVYSNSNYNFISFFEPVGLPITIGRVMQAIRTKTHKTVWEVCLENMISWELTNEDGEEVHLYSKKDGKYIIKLETVKKLLKILK